MQQDHLTPDEIEALLDGEEGFNTNPSRRHLAGCPDCRAQMDEARNLVELLDGLPRISLTGRSVNAFSDSVMARVNVFEPWHVTLADTVRRLVPRSAPLRVALGAGAVSMALAMTTFAVWISLRLDVALYAGQLAADRLRDWIVASAGNAIAQSFGEPALSVLSGNGLIAVALAGSVLVGVLAGATFGLRGLLAAARRRGR